MFIYTERKSTGNGQIDPRHSVPGKNLESGKVQHQHDGPQQDDVEEANQREEKGYLAVSGFAKNPLE